MLLRNRSTDIYKHAIEINEVLEAESDTHVGLEIQLAIPGKEGLATTA